MRESWNPQGIAGYNEVMAPNPSYGPYSVFAYLPYYLGSYITFLFSGGFVDHNYIYLINICLAVIGNVALVIINKPNSKQCLLLITLFIVVFVITRYACSGMIEESYAFFSILCVSCTIFFSKRLESLYLCL